MRKNIWKNIGINTHRKSVVIPTELKTNATNKEGFSSYSMTVEEEVLQALMTGSLANLFYADARENTKMFIEAFNKVDTKFLAQSIVYAREKGFTRTIPIAATVVLSKRDTQLFKKVVHRVMKNPRDWKKFIDICRSKEIRNGLGRALKREINNNIGKMKDYHVIKYPEDVYDMINIARPNIELNPAIINYAKGSKTVVDVTTRMIEAALALQSKDINEDDKANIIKYHRVPYEYITGTLKTTPKVWESLLYVAPYRNLITNLNNFGRNGVFNNPENLKYAIESIMNPDKIKHSMLFPFRFYVAWNTIEEFNGANEIKHALQKALEISVDNIPDIKDTVCIAPDISGSMMSLVTSNESKLRCIDLVGLFTGIIMKKCRATSKAMSILPFNNSIDTNLAGRVQSRETIFDIAKEFTANGCTSLSAPVRYLRQNNFKVDRIIAFTDEEEWVGSSFIDEFYLYKTQIAPKCKAYLVKLIPSKTNAAPPNITDVFFIYGWNENVLKYVTGDLESQLDEVKKIEL